MKRVQPLKYHGKLSRLQQKNGVDETKRQEDERNRLDREREKELRKFFVENPRQSPQLMREMKGLVENKSVIPEEVVQKLCREVIPLEYSLKRSRDARREAAGGFSGNSAREGFLPPIIGVAEPSLEKSTVLGCGVRSINRSFTSNKWSSEERQQLNRLYQEIARPPRRANLELWSLYFDNVADKFRAFHPKRSKDEVIKKLREMIAKRQMKETGEHDYWQQLSSSASSPVKK